jgi:hypothetical protein
MGQKVNPIIYQLGNTKIWKSKYSEKKLLEAAKYSYKNLELNKFIFKFFEDSGLLISSCKISYAENVLFIFVSYFVSQKIQQQKLFSTKPSSLNNSFYKKKKKRISIKKIYFKKTNFLFQHFLKIYKYSNTLFLKFKKRIKKRNKKCIQITNKFEKKLHFKKIKNKLLDRQLKNRFLSLFLGNIHLFFFKKFKIMLNFSQLNTFKEKNFSKKEIEFIQKYLSRLRQFNNSAFFNEGLQIVLLILKKENAVDFLAKYIAKELQKHKKQHFFLNFIEKAFEVFNKREFCVPKNIKIKIKGRFNGVPRSKERTILINNPIAAISIKTKIHYSQETSFSENGTFGIKIWISETAISYKHNVKRTKKT